MSHEGAAGGGIDENYEHSMTLGVKIPGFQSGHETFPFGTFGIPVAFKCVGIAQQLSLEKSLKCNTISGYQKSITLMAATLGSFPPYNTDLYY